MKDRYFTPAEVLAAANDFMPTTIIPCPECGAFKGHAPDCSSTSREDLAQAYRDTQKMWREENSRFIKRICDLQTMVTLWQGKHAIVRHENNKLRAKVAHHQPKPTPKPKKTKVKK